MATAEKQQEPASKEGRSVDLRSAPIGSVSLREGFNPRTSRDKEAFGRTAWSVRESGVLQPVLVTPKADDPDTFTVVAGEGRYLAALQAGLDELPVLVREVDERTGGLELAMAENLAREELDPVAVAGGFARLKAAGWSKRQIAEELSVTQKLVTERLLILKVPETLRPQIASGDIPLSAVRPLARVGEIHADLPAVLNARVSDGKPSNGWAEPMDWADVVDDPIAALTATYTGAGTGLPAGVYDPGQSYPVSDLPLSESALKEAQEIADLQGIDLGKAQMRFAREALQQALSLKSAFPDERGYSHLIVGDDIVAQILGDQITAQLKQARENATAQNKAETTHADAGSQAPTDRAGDTDVPAVSGSSEAAPGGEVSVVEAAEQQRQERAERQTQRKEVQRKARAYNEELGAAVLRNLMRLKIDERVLQVLIATDPLNDLGGLAMRGARYGLPGWTTTETTATGKSKVVFPSRRECATKALEFLEIATSVAELTGRMFVLIVMARYADENAVAVSSGSGWELREPRERPWDLEIVDLIDDICATRLPEHLIEAAIVERSDLHERRRQEAKEQAAARERLARIEERLEAMSEDERAAAIRDAELVHGPYGPAVWELRQKIAAIRNRAHEAETDQKGETDADASADDDAAPTDDDSDAAPDSPEDDADDPAAEASSAA